MYGLVVVSLSEGREIDGRKVRERLDERGRERLEDIVYG